MRKPSFKKSFKARTTGKIKRKLKKSFIPGYGKKGAGWIKNPKKAVYNKVYNKTTFGVGDVMRVGSSSAQRKRKNKSNGSVIMNETVKTPFYKKVWFMVLISVLFPIVGIILMWNFKKEWNKVIKIVLTVIASLWMLILLVICFADTDETPSAEPATTQSQVKEETATALNVAETTVLTDEETTDSSANESAAETTTNTPDTTRAATTRPTTTRAATTREATTRTPTTREQTTRAQTTADPEENIIVYRTPSGSKYHYENPCGNGEYSEISLAEAKRIGLEPCDKCVIH